MVSTIVKEERNRDAATEILRNCGHTALRYESSGTTCVRFRLKKGGAQPS
jgi:hypothetical protein